MNDEEFLKEIWKKYYYYKNSNNKDNFFGQKIYKKTDYTLKLRTFLTLIMICIFGIGISYAGNYTYKQIIQTFSKQDETGSIDMSSYYDGLIYNDGKYYKKILTYNEYLEMTKKWNGLVEMNEKDFENSFVLFILFEDYSYAKTYINDIGATSDTLYIELKKYTDNEEFDIDNNIISVKIDKDLNRENLEIYTIPNEKPTSNEYIELEKIPLDYNKEKAIEDNCFVVENREIISNDKNQLDNFVEKTQNGENAFIRIVEFTNFDNSSYETIIIRDVEYRNGVFLIAGTEIDEDTEKLKISYYTGTELEVKYAKTVEDGPWTEKIYRIKLEDTLEENKKAVICHLKM